MKTDDKNLGNALILNLNEHYQLNKQAQIKNRHIQLLKLADEVIFQKGYSQFKLDMLCELSGCSRGTLYKTFKTKDTLLTELATEVFALWRYLSNKVLNAELSPRNKLRGILISKKICKSLFPSGVHAIYFNVMKQQLDGAEDTENHLFKDDEEFFINAIEQLFSVATTQGDLQLEERSLAVMSYYVWKSIYLDETVLYKMMGHHIQTIEDINIDLFTAFLDLIKFSSSSHSQKDLTVEEYMNTLFGYESDLIKTKYQAADY